jgi:hypothetical protein
MYGRQIYLHRRPDYSFHPTRRPFSKLLTGKALPAFEATCIVDLGLGSKFQATFEICTFQLVSAISLVPEWASRMAAESSCHKLRLNWRDARSPHDFRNRNHGGGRGIRTPGTLSGTAVFKTACFNHSHIPPERSSSLV